MSVRWNQVALDRLADVYVTLPLNGQRELARTVEEITARLQADAASLGESRGDPDRRVWCYGSLAVTFRSVPGGDVVVLFVSRLKHGAVGDADL